MNIPWFSTFTLFTELLVTISLLYVIYTAYRRGRLLFGLAAFTLAYEICFNISYMAYRAFSHANPDNLEPAFIIALAAFHGIFSLLMFVLLLIFMALAWINYKRGINYFALHKKLTVSFVVFWLVAVISGFVFYFVSYF